MTRFYDALKDTLEMVDAGNWREKLGAMKTEHRTWKATADAIGTDKRTLERWRNGYQPRTRPGKPRPARREVDPSTFLPKIRAAFVRDRNAQVGAVDWSRLTVIATWWNGTYRRRQKMHLGAYMPTEQLAQVAGAYVNRNANGMAGIINQAMSDYLGFDARMVDIESVSF